MAVRVLRSVRSDVGDYSDPKGERSECYESGMAILTMVIILLTLAGSYHFYNKNTGNSALTGDLQGRKTQTIGDTFAAKVYNRIADIIHFGEAYSCPGTDRGNTYSDSDLLEQAKRLQRGADNSGGGDGQLIWSVEGGGIEQDKFKLFDCILNSDDLVNIQSFTVGFAFSRSRCDTITEINISGTAKLPLDDTMVSKFELRGENRPINISPMKPSDLGVVFDNNIDDAIELQDEGLEITFDVPVYFHVHDGEGLNLAYEDLDRIMFNEPVRTNAHFINFGEIEDIADMRSRINIQFAGGLKIKVLSPELNNNLIHKLEKIQSGINTFIDDKDFDRGKAFIHKTEDNVNNGNESSVVKVDISPLHSICKNSCILETGHGVLLKRLTVKGSQELTVNNDTVGHNNNNPAWKNFISPFPNTCPASPGPGQGEISHSSDNFYFVRN